MSDKATGGLAFPTVLYDEQGMPTAQDRGMTLRDWLAGQALTGTLSSFADGTQPGFASLSPEQHAKNSYRIADAMLVERSK